MGEETPSATPSVASEAPATAPRTQTASASKPQPYSVLMSVYARDHAPWLAESLESMAAQTASPAEIVLVLDGPVGAELRAAIDAFDALHPGLLLQVPLPKNGGLGRALQAGISHCSCPVIARMDADDYSRPTRCAAQLAKLAEGYDMVGCNVSEFSSDRDHPNALRVLPETSEQIVRFGKRRAPFVHPTFVVRKAVLEAVGGYRDAPYAEDFDLFARLLKAGFRGYNIQDSLVDVRVDADAYRRRGGTSYLGDMLSFNVRQLREGWFGPADFLVRSAANIGVALAPNFVRDGLYKRFLRRRS